MTVKHGAVLDYFLHCFFSWLSFSRNICSSWKHNNLNIAKGTSVSAYIWLPDVMSIVIEFHSSAIPQEYLTVWTSSVSQKWFFDSLHVIAPVLAEVEYLLEYLISTYASG